MQFGPGQQMDFGEVDRRYTELRRQYDSRAITAAEFDAQLQEMVVQDERGTWWGKDRESGQWMYHDGSNWVFRASPTPPPPQPPPTPDPTPGPQPAEVPVGLWIGLGIACAVLSLFLDVILIGFPFGIAGIVFGVLTMRRGYRGGGIAIAIANAAIMLFWVFLFIVGLAVSSR